MSEKKKKRSVSEIDDDYDTLINFITDKDDSKLINDIIQRDASRNAAPPPPVIAAEPPSKLNAKRGIFIRKAAKTKTDSESLPIAGHGLHAGSP